MSTRQRYGVLLKTTAPKVFNQLHPNDTVDDILRRPRKAKAYCDAVRHAMIQAGADLLDLPTDDDSGDSLILGALLHDRKSGRQSCIRPQKPNAFGRKGHNHQQPKVNPAPAAASASSTS